MCLFELRSWKFCAVPFLPLATKNCSHMAWPRSRQERYPSAPVPKDTPGSFLLYLHLPETPYRSQLPFHIFFISLTSCFWLRRIMTSWLFVSALRIAPLCRTAAYFAIAMHFFFLFASISYLSNELFINRFLLSQWSCSHRSMLFTNNYYTVRDDQSAQSASHS